MIGTLTPSLPAPAIQALEQDLSGETRHSWEASSFNGLFESHLSDSRAHGVPGPKGDSGAAAEPRFRFPGDTGESAQDGSPESMEAAVNPQPAGVADTHGPAVDGGQEWQGSGTDSADLAAGGRGAAAEKPEPVEGADGVRGYVEEIKSAADMRLTLAAGDDGVAEVYVRAPGLDAASALILVQAAARLLADYQMMLGRFKVNGRLPGSDDPAESPQAAS